MAGSLEIATRGLFGAGALALATRGLQEAEPSHPRTRIRHYVVERLRAAVLAPNRVRSSQAIPFPEGELPQVFVYDGGETEPQERDVSPRTLVRQFTLTVHVVIPTTPILPDVSTDDEADTVAWLIERLIANDRGNGTALGGHAEDVMLGATQKGFAEGGARTLCHVRIDFAVSYQDEFAVPVGNELRTVGVDWDLGKPDGQLEAEDEIPLEGEGGGA